MRRAVLLALVGMLLVGTCGGAQDDLADNSVSPTTEPDSEQVVIRTRMVVAAEERSEPIATGEVLEGSTLGGSPFYPFAQAPTRAATTLGRSGSGGRRSVH